MLVLIGAALAAALLGLSLWTSSASERSSGWDTRVASSQVTDFARLTVPASAVDVRWGYQNGLQDDLAVLSFRLPQDGVDGFTAGLGVGQWTEGSSPAGPALTGFRRAGAPDPTGSLPLREGTFESLPPAHEAVATTVWLATGGDGFTQVWVYAANIP
ncbi:hypothetical protein [Kitasatospora sp. NPDC091207]|uniref:hypothetical protein n=1 Tax=Kitasatospora sp. NPDC091207 TaxID=3364083 RepID=UPI003810949C